MASSPQQRNPVELPELEELKLTNEKYKLQCTDAELLEYQKILKGSVNDYNFVNNTDLPLDSPKQREYIRPSDEENKHKAWYVKCSIKESSNGKLHGKRIAIKDNTAVAGIPMMNGSRVLEGYIPEYDATVVKRILKEGGEIVGKTTCEDLCYSGGSFLTTYGPVTNPNNPNHSAGGSSSGSGVVVRLGEADMAIGADQAGSIRMPSSNCGIVGSKPTHGLVPYTGAVPIVPCIDHLGPIANTVADCALFLEVLAGYDDGFDYRQRPFDVPEYTRLIYPRVQPTRKLKVAILQESVDLCDQNVKDVFNKAVDELKQCEHLDMNIVNLPRHSTAHKLCAPILISSVQGSMIDGCGFGTGFSGLQSHSLAKKMFDGYKANAHEMSDALKMVTLMGDYVQRNYGPYHIAKSSSLIAHLAQEYNQQLQSYDVLVLPTLTNTACKIVPKNASISEKLTNALNMIKNTAIFDVTGHPALSLNCGYDEDLPVGLMIVGKHYDEVGVLNAASIFEESLKK